MNKPTNPPQGYRMLIEGQDITTARDLIWVTEMRPNGFGHRWAHAIQQTPTGMCLCADTAQPYKEPKNVEDYYFFRCRKIGVQR